LLGVQALVVPGVQVCVIDLAINKEQKEKIRAASLNKKKHTVATYIIFI
jgi:hypothetical protein